MLITNNSSKQNFNGIYKISSTQHYVKGQKYYNKVVFNLREVIYHPFKDENTTFINKQIKNANKAFSFYLLESDHFHKEAKYYILQRTKLGETIKKPTHKSKHTSDKLINKNFIHELYDNYAYGVMDCEEINTNLAEKILKKLLRLNKNSNKS